MLHRSTRPLCRLWQLLTLMLAGLVASGCGGGAPFSIVKVSGTVTYDDGSPIPASGYRVKFRPLVESPDNRNFPRVAVAVVDENGAFNEATTVRYGDGITAGVSAVYLERLNPEGKGKLLVPPEYTDSQKTPLRVDTNDGRSLSLKVPKPKATR
jgi:hypothetical protein